MTSASPPPAAWRRRRRGAILAHVRRPQIILFALLGVTGVALVAVALWLWAPLWLLVVLLIAGSAQLLGFTAAVLSGTYPPRTHWRRTADDLRKTAI